MKIKNEAFASFEELAKNAIKYGAPGNTIYVSIREIGSSVEIAVEDENKQIEPKEIASQY